MSECPICGESSSLFHRYYDAEHLEPNEEWCDYCGFHYLESGDINAYGKAVDECVQDLLGRIDVCDDMIEEWQNFKKKIPDLMKRVDFDGLRKEYGWVKKEEGCWSRDGDYWDKRDIK
jgi:hypothetical protein